MSRLFQAIFGKPQVPPEEQAKEWRRTLMAEGRRLDTQVRKIQFEEQKAIKSAKQAAKQGDSASVRVLARQILHSRKAVSRFTLARAQLNSVAMQLQHQIAQIKLSGAICRSTEVMSAMNELLNVPQMRQMAMSLSKEMTKAGLIDEMVGSALDDALDDDIEEDELDEEVAKVVDEVMHAKMSGTTVRQSALPAEQAQQAEVANNEEDELIAKYNALKSGAA